MSSGKKLSQLKDKDCALVLSLETPAPLRRRLGSLGLYPGASVQALFPSISGDPRAYLVQNAVIAIRNCDAEKIIVE